MAAAKHGTKRGVLLSLGACELLGFACPKAALARSKGVCWAGRGDSALERVGLTAQEPWLVHPPMLVSHARTPIL